MTELQKEFNQLCLDYYGFEDFANIEMLKEYGPKALIEEYKSVEFTGMNERTGN